MLVTTQRQPDDNIQICSFQMLDNKYRTLMLRINNDFIFQIVCGMIQQIKIFIKLHTFMQFFAEIPL